MHTVQDAIDLYGDAEAPRAMSLSEWKGRAWRRIVGLAESGAEFTADDVLDVTGHPDLSHEANSTNNVIGTLFREAKALGIIHDTGRHVPSRQRHRKGGMVRVWTGA